MRKINMFLLVMVIGVMFVSLTSAVTLEPVYSLATTGNTINVTVDTITLKVDQAIVNTTGCSDSICLFNTSWQNGNLIVNHTGILNFTSGTTLTSAFARLTTDNTNTKVITSSIAVSGADYTFPVSDPGRLTRITYVNANGGTQSFEKNQITIVGSTAKVSITTLAAGANTLSLVYGCSSQESGVMGLIKIFAVLALVIFGISLFYFRGGIIEKIGVFNFVVVFIAISIGIAFIVQISNDIFVYCGA